MGYTSVRKCIHIEIRTRFNLIHEKEWIARCLNMSRQLVNLEEVGKFIAQTSGTISMINESKL